MSGYSHYPESVGGSAQFRKRKSRFTFPEVKLLLTEVKRNRHILVGKFNQGMSSDVKKRTWASLAARINEISGCHREVIEIVKKWSDLKCDTKRKVAAMRTSGLSSARIIADLSPIERMVHQILTPGSGDKLSNRSLDEDENSEGASAMASHFSSVANGRISIQTIPVHLSLGIKDKLDVSADYDHSAASFNELSFKTSPTEDPDLQLGDAGHMSDQNTLFCKPSSAKFKTQTMSPSNQNLQTGSSSGALFVLPPSAGHSSLQEHLARSASLSLDEQHASTLLIGALSRSLESVAESVRQMVQMQQEFTRDTLCLQRDTLHVLRDFSSSALALLQDKPNGHP